MHERVCGRLAPREARHLVNLGWTHYVGREPGIWVRADVQQLLVLRGESVQRTYACSTASAGVGNRRGTCRTPLGWHEVAQKVGAGLPLGAVLEGRRWTGRLWPCAGPCAGDLILSRILRLRGLQRGYNWGGSVDTWRRCIYIHGTNAEALLGVPASHGCVRLSRRDVAELFDLVSLGSRVLITALGGFRAGGRPASRPG